VNLCRPETGLHRKNVTAASGLVLVSCCTVFDMELKRKTNFPSTRIVDRRQDG